MSERPNGPEKSDPEETAITRSANSSRQPAAKSDANTKARPLPTAIVVLVSAAIAFHFLAVGALVLAASSGPWPTPFGSSPATGPKFAEMVHQVTQPNYLDHLRMSHNYHYFTNRPEHPTVWFEIQLKDKDGKVKETRKFPQDNVNPWVRFRQSLLAQNLADDEPVQLPRGEILPAPGQKMPTVSYWDSPENEKVFKLQTKPIHLVPRNRQVFRPREWSLALARSYMRHVCREEGFAKAELIRHTREPVLPAMMYVDEPPPDTFTELVCSFGEERP